MLNKIHEYLIKFSFYKKLIELSKRLVLPGFGGLSIHSIAGFFLKSLDSQGLHLMASSISFNIVVAIFPAIIFFFTLIAYLPIKASPTQTLALIKSLIPESVYETLSHTLFDILGNQHGDLLSIGFFLALYFASNGVQTMLQAFNNFSKFKDNRAAWKQKLISTGLTLILSLLVLAAIILGALGNKAFKWLFEMNFLPDEISVYLLQSLNWLVILLFIFSIISTLFYYGQGENKHWGFFSPGSSLATVLLLVTTSFFSYYVNNFNAYNKLYGSIGTLVAILILIYFNTFTLLIGYVLNVSIDKAKNSLKKGDELTLEDLEKNIDK